MAEHEKTLQQLKSGIEAIEGEEAGVQEKLMDLKHELDKHSTKLKDSQQRIKYYQNEVGNGRTIIKLYRSRSIVALHQPTCKAL